MASDAAFYDAPCRELPRGNLRRFRRPRLSLVLRRHAVLVVAAQFVILSLLCAVLLTNFQEGDKVARELRRELARSRAEHEAELARLRAERDGALVERGLAEARLADLQRDIDTSRRSADAFRRALEASRAEIAQMQAELRELQPGR
jgi:septal ring factor EnvC (AmiA/AmiB activator)